MKKIIILNTILLMSCFVLNSFGMANTEINLSISEPEQILVNKKEYQDLLQKSLDLDASNLEFTLVTKKLKDKEKELTM